MDKLELIIQKQENILLSRIHLLQTIFRLLLLKRKVQLMHHYVHVSAPLKVILLQMYFNFPPSPIPILQPCKLLIWV
jgi:hypothetical protein